MGGAFCLRAGSVFQPHNVFGERQNIRVKYRNVVGSFSSRPLSRMRR
jgi:hypothetical protein